LEQQWKESRIWKNKRDIEEIEEKTREAEKRGSRKAR